MKNLHDLITGCGAVREFLDRDVPQESIDAIAEAGKWGLSVLGIQPWRFVVVRNRATLRDISNVVHNKADSLADGVNVILRVTSKIIRNTNTLFLVYNNRALEKRAEKFGDLYTARAYGAELQSIGGAIQNMILQVSELGLGCVWLDAPTFCSDQINELLDESDELVACLAIGYPATRANRSKRRADMIKVV